MLIMKFLAKLLKILRSGATPAQISWGIVFGMILGLTPLMSLHNLIIIFLMIIFEVNIAMAIFAFAIFSGFAYLLDPLFHNIGYYLLADVTFMQGIWTSFYNTPIIALSRFYNTIVMGSLVSSLILVLPVYILGKQFVVVYRTRIDPHIEKLKIVKIVKGSKLYEYYEKISKWRD